MGWTLLSPQRLLPTGSRIASPPSPSWLHPFVSNGDPKKLTLAPPSPIKLVEQEIVRRLQAKSYSMGIEEVQKKPRVLCLHGYRTSASIFRKQLLANWPEIAIEKLDLDFLDAPFPTVGKSKLEGFFDPPYFEWYHVGQDLREYQDYFEESIAYIEHYMVNHGPFDGLLGFSQGAVVSAAVPGMQAQGKAFTKVPKIKFLILISGANFGRYHYDQPELVANAFSTPLDCQSLHFIGERCFLNAEGNALLESFVDPVVIRHRKGHVVPTLDLKGQETVLNFIEKFRKMESLNQEVLLNK